MTNEEIIERLFALKEWLKRNFGEQFPQEYLDSISSAIEFISSPSLPSNSDEAAETYAENILANGEDMFDAIADGFRAGAEWREQQIPKLPDNLDEAAEEIASDIAPKYPDIGWDECFEKIKDGIKAGAEWMAGQGVSMIINDDTEWADVDSFIHKNVDGCSIIQIRKK